MDTNPPTKEIRVPGSCTLPTPKSGDWKPITLRPVRLLVSRVGNGYVGQCLEHDVMVQAERMQDLPDILLHVLVTQCILDQSANVEMLSSVGEAAEKFWNAWNSALPVITSDPRPVKISMMPQAAPIFARIELALTEEPALAA